MLRERFPYSPLRVRETVAVGDSIPLGRPQVAALRFRQVNVKEAFTFQDGAGRFFRASLTDLGARGGQALVYETMEHSPESPLRLALVSAVLARQRMLFVAQKATELGVQDLFPVLTEHSVPPEGLEHEKAHAWPNQALRAARQCRRASVPEVHAAVPLTEVLQGEVWSHSAARYYLDDRTASAAPLQPGPASAILAVGPEGGWSDTEREQLRQAGAQPLFLGGRVLRAETAVVAGLALLQYELGDLKPPEPDQENR